MPALTLVVPGRLETLTGGYAYDRRIVSGLRELGWTVDVRELDASFPWPTNEARAEAVRVLASIASGGLVLIDGLALGVLPAEVAAERSRLRIAALVHHPLALEDGPSDPNAAALETSERTALEAVGRVVVTSRATADVLIPYGVDPDRLRVVEPGTDAAALARGSRRQEGGTALSDDPSLELLSVATVTRRKGHELLIRALAAVPCRNWRLTCVGSLDRDPAAVQQVRALLDEHQLGRHVALVGEVGGTALASLYSRADLFVLATKYEGYGMAVAEALARGIPVIATHTGAIPDLIGNPSGLAAGVTVPADDVEAFKTALARVLGHRDELDRFAAGAREVRRRLPDWTVAARAMADALEGMVTP